MKVWGIKTESEWASLSRDERAKKMALGDVERDMEAVELREMRDKRKPLMTGAKTVKEDSGA